MNTLGYWKLDETRKLISKKGKKRTWEKIRISIYKFFNYSVYIDGYFECFLFLYIVCLSEIQIFNTDSIFSCASLIVTLIIFIIINLISLYFAYKEIKLMSDKEKAKMYYPDHRGYKWIVFKLRRIFIAFIWLFIGLSPFQFSLYLCVQILVLVYSIIFPIFERLVDNINEIIINISLIILTIFVVTLPEYSGELTETSTNKTIENKGKLNIVIV